MTVNLFRASILALSDRKDSIIDCNLARDYPNFFLTKKVFVFAGYFSGWMLVRSFSRRALNSSACSALKLTEIS